MLWDYVMFSTQKPAINLPAAKQHVTKLHQWTARHAGWQVVQGSALYLIPPGKMANGTYIDWGNGVGCWTNIS